LGNDGFFGIGISELVMIAVVALVVLGPQRLPATMRSVAQFLKQIRGMYNELTSQFSEELKPFQDLNPTKLLQELTDPLKDDEVTKPKPVAAKAPVSQTSTAKPAAVTPASTVKVPTTPEVTPPSAIVADEASAAPSGEQLLTPETNPEPVSESVLER
jgi:sec-independent protein translocase protein TatB